MHHKDSSDGDDDGFNAFNKMMDQLVRHVPDDRRFILKIDHIESGEFTYYTDQSDNKHISIVPANKHDNIFNNYINGVYFGENTIGNHTVHKNGYAYRFDRPSIFWDKTGKEKSIEFFNNLRIKRVPI